MNTYRSFLTVAGLAVSTASALAQTPTTTTTAPAAPAPPVSHNWWWIVLIILLVCAAIWYFRHVRPTRSGYGSTGSAYGSGTTTTTSTTGTSSVGVDSDRIAGAAKQAKGSLEEGAGKILGDTKLQAEGKMDKLEGRTQNAAGGLKDSLRDRS